MPPAVAPGTIIDRYRIEAVVGAGSMGDVYRGVDVDLQRRAAIKILSERHRDNRELRARFVREARAVAAISHPNVVQVFTTGSFDGRPYIAMEFLDGIDLGTSVAQEGPWGSQAAAAAILDAARGLDAAARAGLIHRDVKPTNLVMLQEGSVKVTDFGLAKPLEPGDEPALTAMGVVVGTPDYIAPEQARGERIDHRVDIYALGGTLYFLLTGMPPFRTGTPAEDKYLKVVARHLRNPVPDARARNPGADAELAALARAMMAKKATARPSYPELIEQLDAIARRLARGSGKLRRPSTQPAPSDGSGGRTAPTPFVAGERPVGALSEPSDRGPRTGAHSRASTDAHTPAPRRSSAPPIPRLDTEVDDAPTEVHLPRADTGAGAGPDQDDSAAGVIRPGMPRWLVVTTWLAALVFLTGLGLTALGPRGLGLLPFTRSSSALPAPSAMAAPPAERAPEASAPTPARPPEPPAGMLLVTRPDGASWFFVDAAPVTGAAYAAGAPDHGLAPDQAGDAPVTGVSFGHARAFAERMGKRLLAADEWRAAVSTRGFQRAGRLWEWVVDDAGAGRHTTIHPGRGLAARDPGNARDVTFRLAADPP